MCVFSVRMFHSLLNAFFPPPISFLALDLLTCARLPAIFLCLSQTFFPLKLVKNDTARMCTRLVYVCGPDQHTWQQDITADSGAHVTTYFAIVFPTKINVHFRVAHSRQQRRCRLIWHASSMAHCTTRHFSLVTTLLCCHLPSAVCRAAHGYTEPARDNFFSCNVMRFPPPAATNRHRLSIFHFQFVGFLSTFGAAT